MCSTDVCCSNKPAAVAPKPSPIISSFLELGRRKLSMQPKFVAAQKMLLKQKPSKTFVNGLLSFYYFRHLYSAGSAYVLLTIVHELPIDMGNSIYYSNILLGSFQLFLHSDQPLSEGEIIRSAVLCQSGGCIIHAGGGGGFTH